MTSSAFIYGLVVNFRVDLVGRRERRAIVLMAVAVVAVVAASITYLQPATPVSATSAQIVSAAEPTTGTSFQPLAYEVLPGTGRPTGGYFIWDVASRGRSGGH
jgi:hypothetical protein